MRDGCKSAPQSQVFLTRARGNSRANISFADAGTDSHVVATWLDAWTGGTVAGGTRREKTDGRGTSSPAPTAAGIRTADAGMMARDVWTVGAAQ